MRKAYTSVVMLSALLLAACGGGGSDDNTPPPSQFNLTVNDAFPALVNFTNPIAAYQAPGDDMRWFVVEKRGQIHYFQNDSAVVISETFADITARVDSSESESGLLGMAFHPNFDSNGEVFLSYTASGSPLTSIVSRFTSSDGGLTLDESTEEVILRVDQDDTNHNGGQISFGPDGFLYIGLGDGGGSGDPLDRGENPANLLGAMLRIDVDTSTPYGIPSGNPFSGNSICSRDHSTTTNCPEIYAWGLRNPWRWSFDRQTGELWLGDVGQGALEEVDIIEVGNNYGWNHREGDSCFEPATNCESAGLVDPVAEYGRSEGVSITGGYVYRGADIPELFGAYVFGDYVSGRVWTVTQNGSGGYDREELMDTDLNIASFAEREDGELFVVDYFGRLYQIVEEQ